MKHGLWLIKRGPKPDHHRAPFHPVIICTRRHTAMWEAGWSGDLSWVWTKENDPVVGWLLQRWNGLDIDYGHVVRHITMPDGVAAGFVHDRNLEPWTLVERAVWWSEHKTPEWLADFGVSLPADEFSRGKIFDDAGECLLPHSRGERLRESRRKMLRAGKLIDVRLVS